MKYKYFENEWEERPDWIENAKSTVKMVWNTEYKPCHFNTAGNDSIVLPVSLPSPSFAHTTTTSTNDHSRGISHLGDLPDWKREKGESLSETTEMSYSGIWSGRQKMIFLVAPSNIGLTTLTIFVRMDWQEWLLTFLLSLSCPQIPRDCLVGMVTLADVRFTNLRISLS